METDQNRIETHQNRMETHQNRMETHWNHREPVKFQIEAHQNSSSPNFFPFYMWDNTVNKNSKFEIYRTSCLVCVELSRFTGRQTDRQT